MAHPCCALGDCKTFQAGCGCFAFEMASELPRNLEVAKILIKVSFWNLIGLNDAPISSAA